MFDHHCTACDRRQLIFPSQVTGLDNTDHGIVVSFRCWCGSEQILVTGRGPPARASPSRRLSPTRRPDVGLRHVAARCSPGSRTPGCPGRILPRLPAPGSAPP